MLWFILGVIVGLVVGWNLLPQPVWVKALYDKYFNRSGTTTTVTPETTTTTRVVHPQEYGTASHVEAERDELGRRF